MRANLAEACQLEDVVSQGFEPQPQLRLVPEVVIQAAPPAVEQAPVTSRPNLRLVSAPTDYDATTVEPGRFINADSIPQLAAKRQQAAQNAARIMRQNRHSLFRGDIDNVPKPIEVLGTARQVVAAKREHGSNSPQYKERRQGLLLDSERLIGEAASRNEPEYFARKTQTLQPASREYFSHGLSVSSMTKNGLSPTAEPEEQPRRINEHVEEDGTYVPIGMLIAEAGLRAAVEQLRLPMEPDALEISIEVTTISECTDSAIRDYKLNPKGAHGGYRPAMEGIAIRRVHYGDDSGNREEEQVIISGIYITHDIIERVLARRGGLGQGQKLTKTEIQGSQFISVNDGGLMEFVRELDQEAGQEHGINLFMGVEVADDHPKDYEEFIEAAEARRIRLAPLPIQLTEFLIELEEDGMDSQTAETLTNTFLKDKLLTRAKEHPELAAAMFDEATAEGFVQVAQLDAAGKYTDARQLELIIRQNAPDPSYCGASTRRADANIDDEDDYGALSFVCQNGHPNRRSKGEFIDSCVICGISVRC